MTTGQPGFKDHFSRHAEDYARRRPQYPQSLYDFLASLPAARDAAWDCGAGNGQASLPLSRLFRFTLATDASAPQIAQAGRLRSPGSPEGILFSVARAEAAPLRAASMDLVTVAQALHWFDFPAFFAEVRRVGRPGSVFAAWAYGYCRIDPAVDRVYLRLYEDILGTAYWPPERAHIEAGYRSIPMPFPALPAPDFTMEAEWDLGDLLGYLDTWSAVRRYRQEQGEDPLDLVREDLGRAWGESGRRRKVAWPLMMLLGRIHS